MQMIIDMEKNAKIIRDGYKNLQKKYPNRFVALEHGKVIDSDTNIQNLKTKIDGKVTDLRLVLIQFIPEEGTDILF